MILGPSSTRPQSLYNDRLGRKNNGFSPGRVYEPGPCPRLGLSKSQRQQGYVGQPLPCIDSDWGPLCLGASSGYRFTVHSFDIQKLIA